MKKDRHDIDQRLLMLYLLGEISPEGREGVETWLNASAENRRIFQSLEKTWKETGRIGGFPRPIDLDAAWNRLKDRVTEDREVRPPPAARRLGVNTLRIMRILSAAAAVAALAWFSVILVRQFQKPFDESAVILASREGTLTDTLSDGSEVSLNSNSTLTVPAAFTKEERRVELRGEAFFNVAPDSEKPFIIHAAIGQIRVLGTAFQVKAYPSSDLEVFVEEGRVELTPWQESGQPVPGTILKAGERGIIRYPGGEIVAGDKLQPDDLFWVNRKLIFEETRLSLVFNLLRKHYHSDIEVKNERILDCLLSATFNNETDEQILAVIAVSFDLLITRNEDTFIIDGRGCDNE